MMSACDLIAISKKPAPSTIISEPFIRKKKKKKKKFPQLIDIEGLATNQIHHRITKTTSESEIRI